MFKNLLCAMVWFCVLLTLAGCGALNSSEGQNLGTTAPVLLLEPGIPLPTSDNTHEVEFSRTGSLSLVTGWNSFVFPAIGEQAFASVTLSYAGQTRLLKDAAAAKLILNYLLVMQKNWLQLWCNQDANLFKPGLRYWIYAYKGGAVLNLAAPYLNRLLPASGSVGKDITITGGNFGATQGSSVLSYAGVTISPNVWSDTKIRFTVPAWANSGGVKVTVNAESSNTLNYTLTWQRLFGGSGYEWIESTQRTADGGCISAGESDSSDIPGAVNNGDYDFLVTKFTPQGEIAWQKMFGGSGYEAPFCVQQTADGGYVVAGITYSEDIPGCAYHGGSGDFYIVKLSAQGDMQWQQVCGGSGDEWGDCIIQTPDGGYLMGGESSSGDIPGCTYRGNYDFYLVKLSTTGAVQWQKMYGGSEYDSGNGVLRSAEGGYLLVCTSGSSDIPGCINHGLEDYYIVKITSTGAVQWQKMYGGSQPEWGSSAVQNSDRSYVVAGYSNSADIPGCINNGDGDGYVLKLTATGSVIWQSMFGGNNTDYCLHLITTVDGGYAVGGYTYSSDIAGCVNHGEADLYLAKLNAAGAVQWQRTYGGSASEYTWSYCVAAAPDGGYFIGGASCSVDIPGVNGNSGNYDGYVLKVDGNGLLSDAGWYKVYGGSGKDIAECVRPTADGGCIMAGKSNSTNIPGAANLGGSDFLVTKMTIAGEIEWQRMYGGSNEDVAYSVQQTTDGGYIVAGNTFSADIPGCVNQGGSDNYLIKLAPDGTLQWQRTYGGSGDEWDGYVIQTSEGGYLLRGESFSTDIPGCVNHGSRDIYLVKLDSSGTSQWQKMYGGNNDDAFWDSGTFALQTADGGYLVAGTSFSTNIPGCFNRGECDYYVIKIDAGGVLQWQKMYGGSGYDRGTCALQTQDQGYLLGGYSDSLDIPGCVNHGYEDAFFVKLSSAGALQWQTMFGGNDADVIQGVVATSDGGYAAGGYSGSTDIAYNHGNYDFYLVKLNSLCVPQWHNMFGGSAEDSAGEYGFAAASGGGFLLGGRTYSNDILPFCESYGNADRYVVTADADGNLPW